MEFACVQKATVENPDIGDMLLDNAGHEVVLTAMADEVAQRLFVRLNYFRGEWFLNLLEGTPYYEHILIKAPSDRAVRTVFSSVIRQTEGVAELLSLTYSINRQRRLNLSFAVRCADGSVVKINDYPVFVVDDDSKAIR